MKVVCTYILRSGKQNGKIELSQIAKDEVEAGKAFLGGWKKKETLVPTPLRLHPSMKYATGGLSGNFQAVRFNLDPFEPKRLLLEIINPDISTSGELLIS